MSISELFPILMFVFTFIMLLFGFPVAFTLSGSALIFGFIGYGLGNFDPVFLQALPERIFGIMGNETLLAIPLFVFMGVMLEKSNLAEELLETMAELFGKFRGGLAISVCLVGGLLAASTGIVGATVVTMGLISLPSMLKQKYSPSLSSGIICASGTLGQIIPPSIVLIILGDVISSAYQQAQLEMGSYSPRSISVGDLFVGALGPGILLMFFYIAYIVITALVSPNKMPKAPETHHTSSLLVRICKVLIPPFILIIAVLGSILAGIATPTEAASVGSVGAILLAYCKNKFSRENLKLALEKTSEITAMVFLILIGASVFSLVFRGMGGDDVIHSLLNDIHGGVAVSFLIVMVIIFFLGFFLDFFEITFVIVPIVGPVLLKMGLDPIWLGVMIAINLQTSFLTPPFGFSLFYLRGVAEKHVSTTQIYRGVIPFIIIQLLLLITLWFYPGLATHLPLLIFGE